MRTSSDLKVKLSNGKATAIASPAREPAWPSRFGLGIFVLASAAGLTACATANDPRFSLKEGWRAARIDEIGPASALRQVTSEDCRTAASPGQRETGRFAVVSYWSTTPSRKYPSGWFPRIVPLEATSQLGVGDTIYVNTLDCTAPVVARNDQSSRP